MAPIGFFAEISPGRSTIPVANGFFAKVKVAVASNAMAPKVRRTIRVIMEIAGMGASFTPNTRMLFGDAKVSLQALVAEFKTTQGGRVYFEAALALSRL